MKKELYDKRSIFVTVNSYLNVAAVSVDVTDSDYVITICMHDGSSVDEAAFMNQLIENEIKTVINRDTYSVREAIYHIKWNNRLRGNASC